MGVYTIGIGSALLFVIIYKVGSLATLHRLVDVQESRMRYMLIDHTADFGIHVFGKDEKALFENAGLAMFELMVDAGDTDECRRCLLTVEGNDWPDLMVNWLRELLYLWTGKEKILRSIGVQKLTPFRIVARVDVEPFQKGRHTVLNEIKAVTYHQIQAGPENDHWEAKIIFDV